MVSKSVVQSNSSDSSSHVEALCRSLDQGGTKVADHCVAFSNPDEKQGHRPLGH